MKKIIINFLIAITLLSCLKKKDDSLTKSLLLFGASNITQGTTTTSGDNSSTDPIPVTSKEKLILPSAMVIITSKSNSTVKNLGLTKSLFSAKDTALSEYESDTTNIYINDPLKSSLSYFESILKYVSSTGYVDYIDKGPQKVIITDPNTNMSSTTNTSKLTLTVQADSTNGFTPIKIKIWGKPAPNPYYQNPSFQIEGIIREGATSTNPTGDYEVKMTQIYTMNGSEQSMTLELKTIKSSDGSKKIQALGGFKSTYNSQVAEYKMGFLVNIDSSGETGTAIMKQVISGAMSGDMQYLMSWDTNNLYNKSTVNMSGNPQSGTTEFAYDRNTSKKVIWSYGLYDKDTKSRKNLKVSFPVIRVSDSLEGYASENGVYFYNYSNGQSITVNNNDQVREKKYDGSTGDLYTVQVLPGSLTKQTKVVYNINDLLNINFIHYKNSKLNKIAFTSASTVVWKSECSGYNTNCVDKNNADYSNNLYDNNYAYLGFADNSGKNLTVNNSSGSPIVIGYEYENISNLTSDLILYEYDYASCSANPSSPTVTQYPITSSELALKFNGNVVTTQKYQLLPASLSFQSSNDCDQIYNQSTVYSWYPSSGNFTKTRLKTITASVFQFDKPLNFSYKSSEGIFSLNYYGYGNLSIPGSSFSDSDYPQMTYAPSIQIPNGTELTSGGKTYLVKQLYGYEYLKKVSTTSINQSLVNTTFPSVDLSSTLSKVDIGSEPTTTGVLEAENSRIISGL